MRESTALAIFYAPMCTLIIHLLKLSIKPTKEEKTPDNATAPCLSEL